MNSKITTSYYAILAFVTIGWIMATVFTASRSVDYGFQVKKMKIQEANLQNYSAQLKQEIAEEQSLELAQNFAQSHNFVPVSQVITLTNPTQLAQK